MMNPYGYGGYGWGAAAGMGLFGLLILVGIVLLIIWAVRQGEHQHMHAGGPSYYGQRPPGDQQRWQPAQPGVMTPQGYGQPPRDAAVDAARERYARGEITKEQLDEIMRNLGYQTQQQTTSPPGTPPQQPQS